MNRVALTLESKDIGVDALEAYLEALRPVLAVMTAATVHVIVQEED